MDIKRAGGIHAKGCVGWLLVMGEEERREGRVETERREGRVETDRSPSHVNSLLVSAITPELADEQVATPGSARPHS